MTVTAPVCRGCGVPLPPSRGGRPRVWCSERCRKGSYARPCLDCGKPTSGSDGRGPHAPKRCVRCAATALENRERRGAARAGLVEWQDGDLLDALRCYHREHPDRPVTIPGYKRWYRQAGMPAEATITTRFGSWNRACERAGVPHGRSRRESYSRTGPQECVRVVALCEQALGWPPTVDAYTAWRDQRRAFPSASLIPIRCGSWNAAVTAAHNQTTIDGEAA